MSDRSEGDSGVEPRGRRRPLALAGAGKPWSELTDAEIEDLATRMFVAMSRRLDLGDDPDASNDA